MKQHTQYFKNNIKLLGKEQTVEITYTIDDEAITLGPQEINAVTPFYESSLLKSVMKQLTIDSNVEIPKGTMINFKYGLLVDEEYEYLDYGNYIVYSVEKQEDTSSYKIICYDKMLYSMKDYEDMNITYPITIRNYINRIASQLGLTFKNINETFCNYNKEIPNELYLQIETDGQTRTVKSMGYTFRDVLDELAEVVGGVICINANEELEIRYINNTQDTIDEEYLKDINVNFGEKYGPINSIVLSRSAESDNVYLRDETSIAQYGLHEIKIVDNQIMNMNNRSEYLPDLLSALGNIEYYINDFASTGIMYYDLLDRYNVQIGDVTYSCVMFNNEQLITQGLEENIYTNIPDTAETDYTKADKTDQRINQTYLIVDKQNQQIQGVITNVTEQNNKILQIQATVDELNSKIQDIADITISGETMYASLDLDNINESEPISIKVHPTVENISYLYPSNNLYPSNTLYPTNRRIRFTNTTDNTYVDYELPDDLLISGNVYDEFYLGYDTQTCQVIKRCEYNADGTVSVLDEPITTEYEYPHINLTEGNYTISLLGYTNAYLNVRLMAKNIYTSQFATKVEVSSEIAQTAQSIDLSVNQKLSNYSTTTQMNSAIALKANEITESVSNTYATKTALNTEKSERIQSANSIIQTVSQNYETKGEAQTQYSQINQRADSIALEVGGKLNGSEYTNAKIVAKINDGTSAVQINADKVSLARKNN